MRAVRVIVSVAGKERSTILFVFKISQGWVVAFEPTAGPTSTSEGSAGTSPTAAPGT